MQTRGFLWLKSPKCTSLNGAPPPINPAEPPKRKRGRPPGSTKAKAEAPDDDEDSPDAPEITGNGDFWLMLQNFTDDEWNHLSAYVYRVAPKIDRKNNGRKANIQTYTSRFTPDDLMKDHGSGCYQIMLNHQDPGTGKYSRIGIEKVQIINPKYPPVVPDGDWVDDKENEMWKWGAKAVPSASNGGDQYPPGFNIAEMMDKADQRALKMVEIMTPKAPPPKDDTVLTTILEKLLEKSLTPPPAPDNSAMERIFKMQDDTLKELRAEIREMRNKETTPQKSIIEQFVEIQPQIKGLVDGFAQRTGKTDIWASIAEKAIEQLPEAIALGRDIINKPAPLAPQQQQQPRKSVQPPAKTAVPEEAPPLTPEEEARKKLEYVLDKHQEHIFSIVPSIMEYFKVGDGFGLRDWYLPFHGLLNWSELRRDIGAELLRNILMGQRALQVELGPPEALLVFCQEFFTDTDEDEDQTVESTQPSGAAAQSEAK